MPLRPSLHFLCGKTGAGKSTLAKRLAQTHSATLICEDVWITRLFADQMKSFDDYKLFAQRLRTVAGPLTIELLSSGRNVVLDFPANTRTSRAWFRSLYETAGVGHTLHYLPTSNQTCLQRIDQRNTERPEGSHHLTESDFVHISSFFQAPQEDEGFNISLYKEPGDA